MTNANTLDSSLVKLALSQPVLNYMMLNCPDIVVLFLGRTCKHIKACVDLYFTGRGIDELNESGKLDINPNKVILGDNRMTLDMRLRLYRDVTPIKTYNDSDFFKKLANHLIYEDYDVKDIAPYVFDWMSMICINCDEGRKCLVKYTRLLHPIKNMTALIHETDTKNIAETIVLLVEEKPKIPYMPCEESYLAHVLYFMNPDECIRTPYCLDRSRGEYVKVTMSPADFF